MYDDSVDGVWVSGVSDGQSLQSSMGTHSRLFDNDVGVNRIVSDLSIVLVFEGIPVDCPMLSAELARIIHNVFNDVLDSHMTMIEIVGLPVYEVRFQRPPIVVRHRGY